jgi:hypothetical protein
MSSRDATATVKQFRNPLSDLGHAINTRDVHHIRCHRSKLRSTLAKGAVHKAPRLHVNRGARALRHTRVTVTHYGGPDALQMVEEECPAPKRGEVRVSVLAAGVSLPDVLAREGVHPETPRVPYTPGWDLVGIVDQIGEGASGFETGPDGCGHADPRLLRTICLLTATQAHLPNESDRIQFRCLICFIDRPGGEYSNFTIHQCLGHVSGLPTTRCAICRRKG